MPTAKASTRRLDSLDHTRILECREWAGKRARRMALRHPYLSADFESAADWLLCQAALTFDPSRQTRFSTHATRWVKFGLLRIAKQEVSRRRHETARARGEPSPCEITAARATARNAQRRAARATVPAA